MDIAFIAYIVYWILAVLASVFVLTDNKRPSEVNLLWLFILLFVPFFGLLIYIVFGVNLKRKTIFSILAEDRLRRRYRNRLNAQKRWLEVLPTMSNEVLAEKLKIKSDPEGSSNLLQSVAGIARDSDCFKTVHMLLDTCGAPLAANVSTKLFFTGPEAFDSLLDDLRQARETIDMEFYIWHSDRTGKEILAILEERARAGVRIRLIFDSIGCWGKISLAYRRKLKAAGIRFHYFLDPLSYIGHRQINFRSHRKIAVIDEKVCYTGGMNIGDEYRFPAPGKWYKTWRDTMVRLEGDSAAYMQDIFEIDWHNSDRKELKQPSASESDFPEETTDDVFASLMPGEEERSLAQIICSGPDSSFDSIELLYSSLIANANRYVYIESPYFIPSDNVLKSLQTAALSGVQIQIITTGVVDQWIPYLVAETYFDDLTSCGIEIYRYTDGFYHTKMVLIDGKIATVGSCNFDIRSFRLDYEINAVLYDAGEIGCLQRQFLADKEKSQRVPGDYYKRLSWPNRLLHSVLRIGSPLL